MLHCIQCSCKPTCNVYQPILMLDSSRMIYLPYPIFLCEILLWCPLVIHLLRIMRNVIYVRNVYILFGAATAIGFIPIVYMNIRKTVRDVLFFAAQHY